MMDKDETAPKSFDQHPPVVADALMTVGRTLREAVVPQTDALWPAVLLPALPWSGTRNSISLENPSCVADAGSINSIAIEIT